MTDEMRELAWERNAEWVRRRYPHLTDGDIEILRELGTVPLATGEISIGPETVLALYKMIISKRGARAKPAEEKE